MALSLERGKDCRKAIVIGFMSDYELLMIVIGIDGLILIPLMAYIKEIKSNHNKKHKKK